jgi:hypothetical protein
VRARFERIVERVQSVGLEMAVHGWSAPEAGEIVGRAAEIGPRRGDPMPSGRKARPTGSTHDEDVAGQRADELAQFLGPTLVRTTFEHQKPAVEVDDPLPEGTGFGRRGFRL